MSVSWSRAFSERLESDAILATLRGIVERGHRPGASRESRSLRFADQVGCRLITLDAYPESIAFYERLGFARNRSKAYREREHPSMRLDLYAPIPPLWVTG